ncbi:unnamed protein product [Didymodactylos carnosus]|nr:unnamed protein product [Didymodactylos carnosus]CAF4187902.1 unnamed protein product [Didymodactylos carnosus]
MAVVNFSNTILPAVTGYDISGEVVAVGKAIKDLKVGDEAFGFLSMNSSGGGGAFQQYSVADADRIVKKPQGLSHTDASTLGIGFLSAMDGLRQVKINSSTSIFVPGGSGGVGHFIIQVARILGAGQIITSASKEEGINILKELYKIKDVINHATENVVDRVLELTGGQGADIVFDTTYLESSYAKSTLTVKRGGSWLILNRRILDKDSQAMKNVEQRGANLIQADVSRYTLGPEKAQVKSFFQESLVQGAKWVEEGKLKPYVNKIIKLEEVESALEQLTQGKAGFGKVVAEISPN